MSEDQNTEAKEQERITGSFNLATLADYDGDLLHGILLFLSEMKMRNKKDKEKVFSAIARVSCIYRGWRHIGA